MRKPLLAAAIVSVCSIFVLGCSREEQSPDQAQKKVVKKSIVQTQRQKIQADPRPTEGAQPVPPSQRMESRQAAAADATEEPGGDPARLQPEPRPAPAQARASAEQRVHPAPRQASGESQGFYIVQPGDTLARIAGKKEVFRDPLKWVLLYRTNAVALDRLPGSDNLPDLPLPAGMRLRIATPEEARNNMEKRSGGLWVVNVLSATTSGEVIPAVIALSKKEYPVYVSSAKVNEKDWMRVRVGFFQNREQAEAEGRKIQEILHLNDVWVTRMPNSEFTEFAGF